MLHIRNRPVGCFIFFGGLSASRFSNPMPAPAQKSKSRQRLETHVRACMESETWPVDQPLPTTRELAKKFGLSAATAFRLLQRLAQEGQVWQHSSGRFYKVAAQPLLDRPRPVACLIRRLELCSALYRELLEGISAGSGEARRAMLLWHDDVLVNHPDPAKPPVFAGAAAQRLLLDGFLERHGADAGGFVLDHLWADAVLKRAAARLAPGVLLFRQAPAGVALSNVRADFGAAATQALAHLSGRGFDRIVPVSPFDGDPAVDEFFGALEKEARALGCEERLAPRVHARTPEEQAALVAALPKKKRTALIVPEDHVAASLHALAVAAGRACPEAVGVLSVMGTDVGKAAGLSCLGFDFRAMGRAAVSLLGEPEPRSVVFPPVLALGGTT
ncbi:transcriptional regulator [Opitutaceae bacterium TAV1]|nr:transcriptional regulator [Opitutaceae bacterium TAV1]